MLLDAGRNFVWGTNILAKTIKIKYFRYTTPKSLKCLIIIYIIKRFFKFYGPRCSIIFLIIKKWSATTR